MKLLFAILGIFLGLVLSIGVIFQGFCIFFNCQLSITDFAMEAILAMMMATFLVIVIDIHLTQYKFWRFCKIVKVKLSINFQNKLSNRPQNLDD